MFPNCDNETDLILPELTPVGDPAYRFRRRGKAAQALLF